MFFACLFAFRFSLYCKIKNPNQIAVVRREPAGYLFGLISLSAELVGIVRYCRRTLVTIENG